MSNNLRLIESIEDARVVLLAMRERAEELGVRGVSEVISRAVLRELSQVGEQELTNLSLVELLKELISDDQPLMAAILVDIVDKFERVPDIESRGPDDLGTNYLAFAGGKLAQMIRTGADSQGDKPVRRGESAARGGIIKHRIMTAFSGGTEAEDIDISRIGTDKYEELLIARWQEEVGSSYPWLECVVLGEKADKEAIIEQHTPFLQAGEKFGEVTLANGMVIIVRSSTLE